MLRIFDRPETAGGSWNRTDDEYIIARARIAKLGPPPVFTGDAELRSCRSGADNGARAGDVGARRGSSTDRNKRPDALDQTAVSGIDARHTGRVEGTSDAPYFNDLPLAPSHVSAHLRRVSRPPASCFCCARGAAGTMTPPTPLATAPFNGTATQASPDTFSGDSLEVGAAEGYVTSYPGCFTVWGLGVGARRFVEDSWGRGVCEDMVILGVEY